MGKRAKKSLVVFLLEVLTNIQQPLIGVGKADHFKRLPKILLCGENKSYVFISSGSS